jgi:ADP-heptose:LPS heptosyltransferase
MSRLAQRLFILRRLAQHGLSRQAWRRSPALRPRRILVLHHLLLGDTLMLTPLLAKLAEQYPASERLLACPEAFASLYARQPFGTRAIPWNPRTAGGLKALLDAAPYDWIIIPAENRFSLLARVLGARWISAFADDQPAWKNWLVDDAHPFPQHPAAFGDFCAELVSGPAPQTYRSTDWALPPFVPFALPLKPYAVLHLGASTPLKYWPATRWQSLAQWLDKQGISPIWSTGSKEKHLIGEADPEGHFTSFAGTLDLPQLAQLFLNARLVVCPDTGITHLARIVGVPTVALFGPGSSQISGAGEYWRESPFTALSTGIECRNQDVTFRRHAQWIQRCARSYGSQSDQCMRPCCMEGIDLEQVLKACMDALKQQS